MNGDKNNKETGRKIFVGGIKASTTERQLEEAFAPYGQLRHTWVARAPGGFGFVEFEDVKDAEVACQALNGKQIDSNTIVCEISHGRKNPVKRDNWPGKGRDGPYDRPGAGKDRDAIRHGKSGGRYSPDRRSRYSPVAVRDDHYFQDQEIRRLREENSRLRMELDDMRAMYGPGPSLNNLPYTSKYY